MSKRSRYERRIGLFGGTFDPPTIAHLLAAEWAWEQIPLAEIWFVPSNRNPLKKTRNITPPSIRKLMLETAIRDCSHFRVETCELDREGTTYTYDTLKELREKYPETRFTFLAGSDILTQIEKWHRYKDVLEMADFAVFSRPGFSLPVEKELFKEKVQVLELPAFDLSSTLVRNRVREGKSIRFLVPPGVNRLIVDHSLYLES